MFLKTSPTTLRKHALNPDRSRGGSRVAPVGGGLEEEPGAAEACADTTEAGKSETITTSARTVSETNDPTSVHQNPDRRAVGPTAHRVGDRPSKSVREDDSRVAPTPQIDAVNEETTGLEARSRQRCWGCSVHFGRNAGLVSLEILIEHQRQFVSRGVVSLSIGPGCLGLEHFGWNTGA